MQLLTSLQRIPAIFLLIENYKTEGISHHPFGATILQLVTNTPEPFEKRMISDMIIDSQREEYSRLQVETLHEREQTMIDPIEDRPELKHIKEQFVSNLPQISQQTQSQVKNVVRDFVDKDKQCDIPDFNAGLAFIKQAELDEESYNVGFMRPIPKFIDVAESEFHWFSPSIVPEVQWDTSLQTGRKFAKGKALLKKALQQHLTKDQCTQIQKILASDPSAPLSLEVGPESLGMLIKNNPFIAANFLVKMSQFPIISLYLDTLMNCEVSVNSIDVVLKLTQSAKVNSAFMSKYTASLLAKVMQMEESNKDRAKLARVVIGFIKNFRKGKAPLTQQYQSKLNEFIEEFIGIEEVHQFKKLMNKQ